MSEKLRSTGFVKLHIGQLTAANQSGSIVCFCFSNSKPRYIWIRLIRLPFLVSNQNNIIFKKNRQADISGGFCNKDRLISKCVRWQISILQKRTLRLLFSCKTHSFCHCDYSDNWWFSWYSFILKLIMKIGLSGLWMGSIAAMGSPACAPYKGIDLPHYEYWLPSGRDRV